MADAVSAQAYLDTLTPILQRVGDQASGPVQEAAEVIVSCLQAGGVVQAFGSGHSEALAMEIAGRAGGLVPTNRIALRDLVTLGGDPPSVLADSKLERDPAVAARLYELTSPSAADVFVIASNSGINGSTVELARLAKSNGHRVLAFTSYDHSSRTDSRHPSGAKLMDLADVVLDNGAPYGDAVLDLPGGGKACAVSSITAALLAQMLQAEVIRRLLEAGVTPPVYLSTNTPGADEHNAALENQYAGRIRRTA
ncbi:MAG: sugar isomerase domain-containing protein [Nocardioidaceae bacterium]